MCYGSGCRFENGKGECTVISDFDLFHKEYKVSPCAVGGSRAQLSEKDFNDENVIGQMNKIYKRYIKYKEKERKELNKLWEI